MLSAAQHAAAAYAVSAEDADRLLEEEDTSYSSRSSEVDFVEQWLDGVLGTTLQKSLRGKNVSSEVASSSQRLLLGHRHLFHRGLTRDVHDRLHRALLVHATAFQHLLETEVLGNLPESELKEAAENLLAEASHRTERLLEEVPATEVARLRNSVDLATAALSNSEESSLQFATDHLFPVLVRAKHHVADFSANASRQIEAAHARYVSLEKENEELQQNLRDVQASAGSAVERMEQAESELASLKEDLDHELLVHRSEMVGMQKRVTTTKDEVVQLTKRLGEALREVDRLGDEVHELRMVETLKAPVQDESDDDGSGGERGEEEQEEQEGRKQQDNATTTATATTNADENSVVDSAAAAGGARAAGGGGENIFAGHTHQEQSKMEEDPHEWVPTSHLQLLRAGERAAKQLYADEIKKTAMLERRIEGFETKLSDKDDEIRAVQSDYDVLDSALKYAKSNHENTKKLLESAREAGEAIKAENANLELLIGEKSDVIESLAKETSQHASTKDKALQILEDLKSTNQNVAEDNERLKAQHAKMHRELEAIRLEDAALKDQLIARTKDNEESTRQIAAIHEQHTEARAELMKTKQSMNKFEVQARDSYDSRVAAEEEAGRMTAAKNELITKIQERDEEYASAKAKATVEKSNLQTELTMSQQQNTSMSAQIADYKIMETEHYSLQKSHSTLVAEHAKLEGEHEALTEKSAKQEEEIHELVETINVKNGVIDEREVTIGEHEETIMVQTRKITHQEEHVKKLEADITQLEDTNRKVAAELEATEAERVRLHNGYEAAKRQISSLYKELKDVMAKNADLTSRLSAREHEVTEKSHMIAKLLATEKWHRAFQASESERMMRELGAMGLSTETMAEGLLQLVDSIDIELRGRDDVKARIESLQSEMDDTTTRVSEQKEAVTKQLEEQKTEAKVREEEIQSSEEKLQKEVAQLREQKKRELLEKADEYMSTISSESQEHLETAESATPNDIRHLLTDTKTRLRESTEALVNMREQVHRLGQVEAENDNLKRRLEQQMLKMKQMQKEFDAERALLTTERNTSEHRFAAENQTRMWREKYAWMLSNKLKDAKIQLLQVGKQPTVSTRGTQTSYAELWCRTILDPKDVQEQERTWVSDVQQTSSVGTTRLSLRRLSELISAVYQAKVQDDSAAARKGVAPKQLSDFIFFYMIRRYGIPDTAMKSLGEMYRAVKAHLVVPEILRFALAAKLVTEEEAKALSMINEDDDDGGGGGGGVQVRDHHHEGEGAADVFINDEAVQAAMLRAAEHVAQEKEKAAAPAAAALAAAAEDVAAAPLLPPPQPQPTRIATPSQYPTETVRYESSLKNRRSLVATATVRSNVATPRSPRYDSPMMVDLPRAALTPRTQQLSLRPHTTGGHAHRGQQGGERRRVGTHSELVYAGWRGLPSRITSRGRAGASVSRGGIGSGLQSLVSTPRGSDVMVGDPGDSQGGGGGGGGGGGSGTTTPRMQAPALTWQQFAPSEETTTMPPTTTTTTERALAVPNCTSLLGLSLKENMHHALGLDMRELVNVCVPWADPLPLLVHPLAERANEVATGYPGIEAALKLVQKSSDLFATMDLGLFVSPEQLPQLHMLMERAADVLHVDEFKLPRLYVKQHAEADSFAYAPEGAHPCIVCSRLASSSC